MAIIMVNIVKFLQGKKSYILAVCVAVVAAAQYLGWIGQESAVVLYGLLGAGSVASLRAGISGK